MYLVGSRVHLLTICSSLGNQQQQLLQWLNQGCVAMDLDGGTIGLPLNKKGGGVYALEWDPINRHIRSWVFSPHESMPGNLVDAIRTAHLPPKQRTAPDPQEWRK